MPILEWLEEQWLSLFHPKDKLPPPIPPPKVPYFGETETKLEQPSKEDSTTAP